MEELLIINPGSTSTKIAVFEEEKMVFETTITHTAEELNVTKYISEQYPMRKKAVLNTLNEREIDLKEFTAIVGRGGAIKPLIGGTYAINEEMLQDCRIGYAGQHASVIGALMAYDLAKKLGIASYVVDPPTVDEMSDIAKVCGLPGLRRKSRFHALNQKAVAHKAAQELGKKYEDSVIIVAVIGGGISVGIHVNGRVIDVNDCGYGAEGPFSPERSGSVPTEDIISLCFSGRYTKQEVKALLVGKGGVLALLGTTDMREVERRVTAGDAGAKLICDAMAYQVAKAIAALSAVVSGKLDGIVLSGGIAHDKNIINQITERVEFLAKVFVYPGEKEMEALAKGALRVRRGQEEAKEYNELTIRL